MNRKEFMQRLEYALRGMPAEERRRAVEYYESYFDEAGPENEAEVIQNLGVPEKVAADILQDFQDVTVSSKKTKFQSMDRNQKVLALFLIIIALICVVPACIALIGGAGGLLIGLICVILAVFIIVPALAVAAFGCAIGFGIAAVVNITINTAQALLFLGIGIICIAVGIWLCQLTVYLFRTVFPAIINSIVSFCRGLLDRLRGS